MLTFSCPLQVPQAHSFSSSFLLKCIKHFMMPKPRGCLTHLCSCLDCTPLTHSLRMMYLADEQHNCQKKKFLPCKHMEASSALKTLWKWSWSFTLFYLHCISKKAFTFFKHSSNDLPALISTSFSMITVHMHAHTQAYACAHTHTYSDTVILSCTPPRVARLEIQCQHSPGDNCRRCPLHLHCMSNGSYPSNNTASLPGLWSFISRSTVVLAPASFFLYTRAQQSLNPLILIFHA